MLRAGARLLCRVGAATQKPAVRLHGGALQQRARLPRAARAGAPQRQQPSLALLLPWLPGEKRTSPESPRAGRAVSLLNRLHPVSVTSRNMIRSAGNARHCAICGSACSRDGRD